MLKVSNSTMSICYDNTTNTLVYNGKNIYDSEDFSLSYEPSASKDSKPQIARIKMGHRCNMACSYCLQEPLGNKKDKNPVIDFSKFPDLSEATRIEIWGGEPLLYWEAFKRIATYVDREDLLLTTVTNGSLLEQKHLDFFLSTKATWSIAISHDGLQHNLLRGINCLEDPKRMEVINNIRSHPDKIKLMLNCTISENNWDVYNNLVYFTPFGIPVNFEIITGYDDNSNKHVLNKNIKKHQDSIRKVYLDNTLVSNGISHFNQKSINSISNSFRTKISENKTWGCGLDYNKLISMDTQGNLIICPNVVSSYGHHSTSPLITKVVSLEHRRECKTCPVVHLCQGGCPIQPSQLNCNSKYAHYITLLELAITKTLRQTELMRVDNG